MPVYGASRVLAAFEFDNQPPLATNKVDVVPIDRLLADEFEATELPAAKAPPQREFGWREGAAHRSRPLSALMVPAPQRGDPSAQEACPSPRPSPRERGEGDDRLSPVEAPP